MKRPIIRIPLLYKTKCLIRDFISPLKAKNEIEDIKQMLVEDGCVFDDANQQIQTYNGINIKYNKTHMTTAIYCLYEVFHRHDYQLLFNKEAIFIDIGMNLAVTSLYFANNSQVKKVYSFEPFKQTYDMAMKNINANQEIKDKIVTFNFGLGKTSKQIEAPYNPEQSGCMSTSLNPFEKNPKICKEIASLEKVQIEKASEKLTQIIDSHYGKEKIILKIDTEGAEFEIFEDLENAKLFQKIDIVMLEYHYRSPRYLQETLVNNDFIVIYKPPYQEDRTSGMILAFKNTPTLQ